MIRPTHIRVFLLHFLLQRLIGVLQHCFAGIVHLAKTVSYLPVFCSGLCDVQSLERCTDVEQGEKYKRSSEGMVAQPVEPVGEKRFDVKNGLKTQADSSEGSTISTETARMRTASSKIFSGDDADRAKRNRTFKSD